MASCSAITCLAAIEASAAPPRTVKSSPPTTIGRPSSSRPAEHEVGRLEAAAAVGLEDLLAGDGADLVERARVDELVDPLADGELAVLVLAGDLVGAAHLSGLGLEAAQLVDLRLPVVAVRVTRSSLAQRPLGTVRRWARGSASWPRW